MEGGTQSFQKLSIREYTLNHTEILIICFLAHKSELRTFEELGSMGSL